MKLLEDMILEYGKVLPGNILKVDSFLNHQIDPDLFMKMGEDFYAHFKEEGITKVLTLEVSGIGIALTTALCFGVPMVFAKKSESKILDDNVWKSKVFSYTKNKEYNIRVSKNYLEEGDRVLIIDDFLANGRALSGLIDICEQAGAGVGGIGIAIEKSFQEGGEIHRSRGYDVYSQARVKSLEGGTVVFENEN